MIPISTSILDERIAAYILFALGVFPFLFSLISLHLVFLLAGSGMLLLAALLYFFGRCSYAVSYDKTAGHFRIANRKESLTIMKKDVFRVRRRMMFFHNNWSGENCYFHVLTVKNQDGKTSRYRFLIWSNQLNLLENYDKLERSIKNWKEESTART
jgi:hypothetical protein